jgi:hypothetical protein
MGTSGYVLGGEVMVFEIRVDGSGDYMQGTRMQFKTKEDAILFAEKQGSSIRDGADFRMGILRPRTT